MNKIMKSSTTIVVTFMVMTMVSSLSSCSFSPTSRHLDTTPVANSRTNSKIPVPTATKKIPTSNKASSTSAVTQKTVNVTLYVSDAQCQELIPQQVLVPIDKPVTSAVSKIIEQRDSGDFSLSGYRVTVKNGVATVDLQISPNSQRQFTSLSMCEQFGLFGSLRKTLLSHSQWNIQEVRFTERGKNIVL